MKTPARRLGRGLGAFLDFDPAGDDGEAFIEDAIGGAKASVIQTSTTSADLPVRAAPVAARAPAPAAPPPPAPAAPPPVARVPVPRVAVPPAPPAEVREPELPFFDDVIVTDISFEDEAVELAPPPPPQRVAVPEPPRAVAPPPPPPPPPPPARAPENPSGFLDEEFVTGIAFPEVDLE
jgi:hypothetical protein